MQGYKIYFLDRDKVQPQNETISSKEEMFQGFYIKDKTLGFPINSTTNIRKVKKERS